MVATALDSDTVTLMDIREPEEFQREGHIPGAVLAPSGKLEFWADPTSPYHREEFSPEAQVILYCASSGRSALAVRTLQTATRGALELLDFGCSRLKSFTTASDTG